MVYPKRLYVRVLHAHALGADMIRPLIMAMVFHTAMLAPAGPAVCRLRPPLVEYIARREGFGVAGALPTRLHNPGSLKFRRQRGARPGRRGFAAFERDADGWAALERDVRAKLRHHVPLSKGWVYLGENKRITR